MKFSHVFILLTSLSIIPFKLLALEQPELRLLTFEDPPYVYFEDQEKSGLAIKVIEQLMTRANIPYHIEMLPPKRALIIALNHPNTCVFPLARSQEREVQFSWISPVVISQHGFFKRREDVAINVRVLTDALPYSIGSFLGSGIGEYLESLSFKIDLAASNEANIYKLKAGRIDLWASDILSANYIMSSKKENSAELALVFFTTLKGMACHRGLSETTIEHLNEVLKVMYQDGTIENIRSLYE